MRKRLLFIFVPVIILIIIGIILFFLNTNKQISENQVVLNTAEDFTKNWYTYTKQTDKKYLNSIKPLMTEKYFSETEYLSTERPKDFEGQPSSSVKVKDSKIISINKNEAEVLIEAEQKENNKVSNLIIRINLMKDAKWLVSYSNVE